jgi:hypothetical protein
MQPSRPTNDQPNDRRVTVVEAAAILGVTPDAVRSRLRRGTLKRDEAPDGTVLVVLEDDAVTADYVDGRDGRRDETTDRSTDHTTVAYINGLTSKIELLERELADWKEEAKRKDHLLAAALERIPQIEAPQEASPEPRDGDVTASWQGARGRTPPGDSGDSRGPGEAREPWWKRWFVG